MNRVRKFLQRTIGRFKRPKVHRVDVVIAAGTPRDIISRHIRPRQIAVEDFLTGNDATTRPQE